MWLRNCCYVMAWDHEVPPAAAEAVFTRTVLNEPTRRTSTAMAGWWRWRAAAVIGCPLSKGSREGECIRCGYHGLKFDPQGLRNPHHGSRGGSAAVLPA
jgi:vanillate O-demethylase monooxygenase subunit